MPNTIATLGDLRSITIWVSIFGKLLVEKGVLSKDDIIKELNNVLQTPIRSDSSAISEIKNMIETVKKWQVDF